MSSLPASAALGRRGTEIRAMGGLFLAGSLAYGIGVYAFTQFLNPIAAEFGWGRAVLGGLMSAFWLAAPFVLIASYAIERVGIRAVVLAGGLLEAAGFYWSTRLSSPFEFFVVRLLMGAGKCLVVTPLPIAVARWFRTRTGFAFAIALCGWHVGGFVMAPFAATMIAFYGWRTAALALALLLAVGMTFAIFLMRPPSEGGTGSTAVEQRATAPEVPVSALALVALGVATIAFYAGYAAFLSQLSPMLKDVGLDANEISEATSAVSLFAMAGVILGGLVTQLGTPRVATGALLAVMAVLEVGATALRSGVNLAGIAAFVIPVGLLIGGGDPILIETLRRSVPAAWFGRTYGFWYLVCLLSLAVVPVIVGAYFDAHASYRGVFVFMAICTGITALGWCLGARDRTLH